MTTRCSERGGLTLVSTPIGIIESSGTKLPTSWNGAFGSVSVQTANVYFLTGNPSEGSWLVGQEDPHRRAGDLIIGEMIGCVVPVVRSVIVAELFWP